VGCGDLGDLGVVRREQDDAAAAGDVLQQCDDPLTGVVVELRGRLVGEEQQAPRLEAKGGQRESPGHGHALALASGELFGEVAGMLVQPHRRQRAIGQCGRLSAGHPGSHQRDRDVVARREHLGQRAALRDQHRTGVA
jgi:hypothetical protein